MSLKRLSLTQTPSNESTDETKSQLSLIHRSVSIYASSGEEDEDDGLSLDAIHNTNSFLNGMKGYHYDIDEDAIREILLNYVSTPTTQQLLTSAFDNLVSLHDKELPAEFDTSYWDWERPLFNLLYGDAFYSEADPDYSITFANTMLNFITDELWDRLVSNTIVNLENIKKEDIKPNLNRKKFVTCLLETDYNPPQILHMYPKEPKKVIRKMTRLYRDYFDISHLHFEAYVVAVCRCLLYAIQVTINTYEGDPDRSILV